VKTQPTEKKMNLNTRFSDDFEVDGKSAYDDHNPSVDPKKIWLMNDQIMIVRFPTPTEESKGGIVMPLDTTNEKEVFPPNCSRVLAVGPNCKVVKPGDYVFWAQKVDNDVEYLYKPQPLVGFYSKDVPTLWTLSEKYVLAIVPHAGNPEWHEVGERETVFIENSNGEMEMMPLHRVGVGDRFKMDAESNEKLKRVMAVRKNGDDIISIYGAEIE
jgi:co-chaperonin GroES (HSP10)